MTIELTDYSCNCCRRFSQFLFVSICDHFQMKRDFWQTFYLQYFSKHDESKQSAQTPSDFPLEIWFCGRWIIGRICIRYLWQKQWFWTTYVFVRNSCCNNEGRLVARTDLKSFLKKHCPRLNRHICRKGASSPGGKLFSVYRQNRRLHNGNLTNVW